MKTIAFLTVLMAYVSAGATTEILSQRGEFRLEMVEDSIASNVALEMRCSPSLKFFEDGSGMIESNGRTTGFTHGHHDGIGAASSNTYGVVNGNVYLEKEMTPVDVMGMNGRNGIYKRIEVLGADLLRFERGIKPISLISSKRPYDFFFTINSFRGEDSSYISCLYRRFKE